MSIADSSTRRPTVLVTGAAKRLGRAISIGMAQAGWRVAVHFNHSNFEAKETAAICSDFTPGAISISANLDSELKINQMFSDVVDKFDHLDAVINNASVFDLDTASTFSMSHLDMHMRVNLSAPILLANGLHKHLRNKKSLAASGVVVNLLDQKLWNPNPDFLSYTLSKGALEQVTTLLAQALAPEVRVVGVAPGLTLNSHLLSQKEFEQLHKLSPLGKSSTIEDVVSAIVFACQNKSITGTTILVDGGQHLSSFKHDFSLMGKNDA
jgi:NAD(P)-dependent dehydrogenase (short-subunit alcohol dehydrogenase family)